MGQKVNQRVFKTSIWKYWFSKFSEKKKHETAILSLRDKEIKEFLHQKFKQKKLNITKMKIAHAEKQLTIFISYFKFIQPKIKKRSRKIRHAKKKKYFTKNYFCKIRNNLAKIAKRRIKSKLNNIRKHITIKNKKTKTFFQKVLNNFKNYNKLKYFKKKTLMKNSKIGFLNTRKAVRKSSKLRLNNLNETFSKKQKLRYKFCFFTKEMVNSSFIAIKKLYFNLKKMNSKRYNHRIVLKRFLAYINKHLKTIKAKLFGNVSKNVLSPMETLENFLTLYSAYYKRYSKKKKTIFKKGKNLKLKLHRKKNKIKPRKKIKLLQKKIKQLQKRKLKNLKRKIRSEIRTKKFENQAFDQKERYSIFLKFITFANYIIFACNNDNLKFSAEKKYNYIFNKTSKKLYDQQRAQSELKTALRQIQKITEKETLKSSNKLTSQHVKKRTQFVGSKDKKILNFLFAFFFKKTTSSLYFNNKEFKRFILKKRVKQFKTFFKNSKSMFYFFLRYRARIKIKPIMCCLKNNTNWELTKVKTTNLLTTEICEVLNKFVNKKIDIKVILNQIVSPQTILNKFKSNSKPSKYAKNQQKIIKNYNLGMWKYRQDHALEEGFQTAFSSVTNQSTSFLLAKFIAKNLRRRRKHKYFLKLIKALIVRFKKKEKKKLKYIHFNSKKKIKAVKVVIKGKLNNGRRKKKIIIMMGKGIKVMTLKSQLDHSTVISFGKKGTFGVKVWILLKKDKNKLDFFEKSRKSLLKSPSPKKTLRSSLILESKIQNSMKNLVKNDCQKKKCLGANKTTKCTGLKNCFKFKKLLKKIKLLKEQKKQNNFKNRFQQKKQNNFKNRFQQKKQNNFKNRFHQLTNFEIPPYGGANMGRGNEDKKFLQNRKKRYKKPQQKNKR